jgi:hypothetical protein
MSVRRIIVAKGRPLPPWRASLLRVAQLLMRFERVDGRVGYGRRDSRRLRLDP